MCINIIKDDQNNTINNTTTKIENGLFVHYCSICGNRLDYLEYGGYDYCKSKGFDCKKCSSPCTGLKNSWETGYETRTVHGICKKCDSKIEIGGC